MPIIESSLKKVLFTFTLPTPKHRDLADAVADPTVTHAEMKSAVRKARRQGDSWEAIADTLGVSVREAKLRYRNSCIAWHTSSARHTPVLPYMQ